MDFMRTGRRAGAFNGSYPLNLVAPGFTHYVAPYASVAGATSDYDTTNGTPYASATSILTPCTMGEYLANAVAGNTAGARGGTYIPDYTGLTDATIPAFRPTNSGSAGNPITIKAYTGETPVINGNPSLPDVPAFGATTGSDYIIWDGFSGTIADTSGGYNTNYLFHFYESQHSEVRNCSFTGVVNGVGGNTALIRFERAHYSKAYNNTLTGNLGGTNETNTAAIWIFGSTNVEAYQNDITNCSNGIMQKTGPNQNNLYYLNYIYAGVSGGTQGAGIFLNEQFSTGIAGSVYNNLIINMNIGVWIEGVSTVNTMNDAQIYNNTIYGSNVGIYTSNFARNADIWNNIASECTAVLRYYIGTALPATSNYNCLYHSTTWRALTWEDPFAETEYLSLANWISGVGLDTPNTIDTNPTFVNAGGTTPADYVLDTGSPCIGTGLGGANMGVLDLAQVGVQ